MTGNGALEDPTSLQPFSGIHSPISVPTWVLLFRAGLGHRPLTTPPQPRFSDLRQRAIYLADALSLPFDENEFYSLAQTNPERRTQLEAILLSLSRLIPSWQIWSNRNAREGYFQILGELYSLFSELTRIRTGMIDEAGYSDDSLPYRLGVLMDLSIFQSAVFFQEKVAALFGGADYHLEIATESLNCIPLSSVDVRDRLQLSSIESDLRAAGLTYRAGDREPAHQILKTIPDRLTAFSPTNHDHAEKKQRLTLGAATLSAATARKKDSGIAVQATRTNWQAHGINLPRLRNIGDFRAGMRLTARA
ncbi:MAG: hypothetical protein Q7T11_00175 [Deltaproteobacteria bacterium]|nr:hypothetical protein [Deltaproteobacteria bacterium]